MLAYENRPFADSAGRALIERHNETVPVRGATVIFLGDYLLGERDDEDELRKITRQLHGDTKILLPGNHDRLPTERYERVFDRVVPKDAPFSVRRGGREIGCVHSPMTIYLRKDVDVRKQPLKTRGLFSYRSATSPFVSRIWSSFRAAPTGFFAPVSHFCKVETLTFRRDARSVCFSFVRHLSALMFSAE